SARQRHADDGDEIVDENQNNGEYKARAFAAFLSGKAERDANQHQHKACGRQGQAAVEFYPVPAGKLFVGIVFLAVELLRAELRHGYRILRRLGDRRLAYNDVSILKSRNRVFVSLAGIRV